MQIVTFHVKLLSPTLNKSVPIPILWRRHCPVYISGTHSKEEGRTFKHVPEYIIKGLDNDFKF